MLSTCFAVLLAFSASAQTDQGHYLIGGDLPFSARLNNGSSIALNANFAYFLIDNFALGGTVQLSTGGGYTDYLIGPIARYYFKTGNDKLKPFLQGALGLRGSSSDYGSSTSGLGGNVAGGLAIFLNEHIALEPNVRVDFDSRDGATSSGTVSLNLGIQAYLP